VVNMVLLLEGALLGELWSTSCYCGREQYLGNCGEHVVILGGCIILGIVIMVLLWEGAILGELC
jgi:hypothetical protein